ncbi:hypothetical protein Pmar_PMAR023404 [Perkinsus marinus ATCC 50983]|uniref:Histone acetyltransferase n=1 Tax=Perkinsus marinus (strain ATCC 50983 / TXsc) TaxID=423536 RepID=C5KKG7_PERM5|nr:hypothetical protein Pmar_PMAR023404 [Perkinsus marinus ATCC 50983]EER15079.1 hypothetical protein Pmar_PMAR023404 [Perkinsus marinus ATCC 50983]|eukprot:XP_002783283.1 hypothetical protein Pmar_PMAR023404 [Perkinsus marinus ATCC 50983]
MLAPTRKQRVTGISPAFKKRRLSGKGVCELEVVDVMRFYFDDAEEGVPPTYVHQSFDETESFVWLKSLTPLLIRIDVDTRDLSVGINFEHPKMPNDKLMKAAYKRHCDTLLARMHTARFSPLTLKPFYSGCKAFRLGMNGKDNSLLKKLKAIPRPTAYASALPSTLELVTIPESLYEFWRRAEWLMLWFIDASGTIDLPSATDGDREECGIGGRWTLYLLRDALTHRIKTCASVYSFPLLVEDGKRRIRVAQFLTMPSDQRKGYGGIVYHHIATAAMATDNLDEITFEDPSPSMQSLREVVTLALCFEAFPDLLPEDKRRDPMIIAAVLKIPMSLARRIAELEWFAVKHYPSACSPSIDDLCRKESKALGAERLAYKQRQRKYCAPDDSDFPEDFIELGASQQKVIVKAILQMPSMYSVRWLHTEASRVAIAYPRRLDDDDHDGDQKDKLEGAVCHPLKTSKYSARFMFRARSIRPRLAFTPDRINVERPLLKSEIKGNEIDQACGKSHFNHKKVTIDGLYEVIRLAETPIEYGTCMVTLNRYYNLGVDLRDPVLTTKLLACAIKLKRKDQAVELTKAWQKWLRYPPNPKLLHALMVGLNALDDAHATRDILGAIRSNWAMDVSSIPYEMAIEAFCASGQSDEVALLWTDAVDTMGIVLPCEAHVNVMVCALMNGDVELAKEVEHKGLPQGGMRPRPARCLAAQAWLKFVVGDAAWLRQAEEAMKEARRIGNLGNQPIFHPGFVKSLLNAGAEGNENAAKFSVKAETVLGRFYTGTTSTA